SIFQVPMSLISLVEKDRQWFLTRKGLDATETPRTMAFCAHAIAEDEVLVVPDALKDERFCTNPLVMDHPHIRFYAGAPLRSPDGHNLGTLCVIDQQPRQPSGEQIHQLQLLSELVMREIELRRIAMLCPITGLPMRHTFLAIGDREFRRARQDGHPLSLLCFDIDNLRQVNSRWGHQAGDKLLLDLVTVSRGYLREVDFAARLGDGEFALLLVGMDHDQAMGLADSLRQAVPAIPGVYSHSDFQLHISGGLTSLGSTDRSFADLIQRAARALELAKSNGRNQIASLFQGL
ncbi:MAG: sensor domain-containing diguanylate cyclase, partial [Cyanobium sp.]